MSQRPYERKAVAAGVECWCWDHLRAVGVTPPRGRAHLHKDVNGHVFRTDNGEVAKPADEPRAELEEAA